jgi:hypothetical protein
MTRLGNTSAGSGWIAYGQNVQNAAWSIVTMPAPGGYINDIGGYFDTDVNGSATCYLCIWNGSNGALIAAYAVGPVPNGSHSAGGQQWWSYTISGQGLYIAASGSGTPLAIGFWAPQYNGLVFTTGPSGVCYSGTQSGSGPGTASGPSVGAELCAYVDYTALVAPSITSISPNPAPPGSQITISGSSFLQATSVTIGGVSASFTVNSDTQITATVPSGVGGNVTVTVTNPAGSGSASMTVGQIWCNPSSGVASIKNIWCNPGGTGVALVKGVWVPNGSGGVKRVW